VRTNLQLKGTVDPETAAQILFRSGVPDANAQNLAQPPLETWVSDDVTKPQAQAAGNNPLDDAERMQAMQHAEEQHAATQARSAADISLVQKRTEQIGSQPPQRK
jgi:hypothetical protein